MRPGRAAALLLCLLAPAVSAHANKHHRRAELTVRRSGAEALVMLDLFAHEADAVRRLFDRNRDRRLEGDELGGLRAFLGKRAAGGFDIVVGGRSTQAPGASAQWSEEAEFGRPLRAEVRLRFRWEETSGLRLRDGGDTAGHLPVAVRGGLLRLPQLGARDGAVLYDLPARTDVPLAPVRD